MKLLVFARFCFLSSNLKTYLPVPTSSCVSYYLRWNWVTSTVTGLGLFHPGHLSCVHQTNYKSSVCIVSSGSSRVYISYTTDVAGAFHQLWSSRYYWYPPLHKEFHQAHLTYYLGANLSRYLARGIPTRASSHIILCNDDPAPMLSMRPLILYRQHSRVCHNKQLF